MKYSDWLVEWLAAKRISTKPATYAIYALYVHTHIIPSLGEHQIEDLTEEMIQKAVDDWKTHGNSKTKQGLSKKTVKEIVGVIHQTLKRYSKKYGLKLPSLEDLDISYTQKAMIIEILSIAEQETLVRAMFKVQNKITMAVAFGLFTGMRIGEICALKWDSIDSCNMTIHVMNTVQTLYLLDEEGRNGTIETVEGTPKTEGSERMIPIPSTLSNLLFLFRPSITAGNYVLTGTDRPASPQNIRTGYYRLLNKLGIRKVKFHALRHTFGTRAITCGIDPVCVSMIMGHASPDITMKLYCHPQMDDLRRSMQKLEHNWTLSVDKSNGWVLDKN